MEDQSGLIEIIDGCRAGRQDSFNKLVDMYSGRFFGYFLRLTGNRAISNDLLSELFLRIVEKIGSFKDGSFEKWLFTIASNIFHDYLRQKQRQQRLIKGKTEQLLEKKPALSADTEMSDKRHQAPGRLDAETAELLMLRFFSELSFKELAEMRNEPIGTTLSKVHRGLKKLRELMENKNE